MRDLPSGTVTFFFSDLEGSTRLIETDPERYPELLERHRRIVRDALAQWGGSEVNTEGDSFFAVFGGASAAVSAAVEIQRKMAAEAWPPDAAPRVRIGLHTGEAQLVGDDYVGLEVHRAARIMAAANGNQILMSDSTRSLAARGLDAAVELTDLGERGLRDLAGRERLFRVWAPGMADDTRPARTLDAAPNNLPIQASPLIGRQEERTTLRGLLSSRSVRLLTLTGPGGIGKTRLSLQAAADQIDAFPDGVYFIDLAPSRDEEAALRTIAAAIGAGSADEADIGVALANRLRGRRVLLVLDNFEQVMAAADDVAALVAQCPALTVLVTSREALRVRGERLFPVQPLSLPGLNTRSLSPENLLEFEAVRLFVERARDAAPDFALTDENAAAVAEICVRLDGLPLAIELATARLRIFSVDELRDRLKMRLDVLRGGARDLPERQRTLRGAIEWSHELLDDNERTLFRLMSIFPSARVEAVETIAQRVPATSAIDVLDGIASLVDKSLVRSSTDSYGQRLRMLDTIREYATERLNADPAFEAQVRRAHATYFARFAEQRGHDLRASGRARAMDELGAELGNLQAAWAYLIDERAMPQITRLVDPLWVVLESRGWYREIVVLANDTLGVLDTVPPDPTRTEEELTLRMSLARGLLALRGYTQEVEDLYQQALTLAEATGRAPRRLAVLRSLASYHLYRADVPQSLIVGRQILELAEQEHDIAMEVEGHLVVGPASAFLGDPAGGMAHLDRAIELFNLDRDGMSRFRLGPNPGVVANAVAGLLRWEFGYPETAERHAAAAHDIALRLGQPYTMAYAFFHGIVLDLWNERMEAVRKGADEVFTIADEHDYRVWKALALVLGGVAESALGDPHAGLERAERGIALYENLNTPPVFWPLVLGLRAQAFGLAGRPDEAMEHLSAAIGISGAPAATTTSLFIQRADLEQTLGDSAAAASTLWEAIAGARRGGARMQVLIAATRLAGLATAAEKRDALQVVRETYAEFTEGFQWPPLREAAALIGDPSFVDP